MPDIINDYFNASDDKTFLALSAGPLDLLHGFCGFDFDGHLMISTPIFKMYFLLSSIVVLIDTKAKKTIWADINPDNKTTQKTSQSNITPAPP